MATSRERLNQTLNHIEPEEVVVDMGADTNYRNQCKCS